jgi:hypothetical protein
MRVSAYFRLYLIPLIVKYAYTFLSTAYVSSLARYHLHPDVSRNIHRKGHHFKPTTQNKLLRSSHRSISMKLDIDLRSEALNSLMQSGMALMTKGPSIAKEVSVRIHPADIIFTRQIL